MGKEKPADSSKKEKKEHKKDRSQKRSSKDGVHKSSKSSKKDSKILVTATAAEEVSEIDVTTKLLNTLEETKPGSIAIKENGAIEVKVKAAPLLGALVPFANPLADEKVGKKVLKSVKKGIYLLHHLPFLPISFPSHHTTTPSSERTKNGRLTLW